MHKLITFLAIVAVGIASIGCGSDEPAPFNICDNFATAYEGYSAGLSKDGAAGKVRVTLVSAEPAPPGPGINAWQLQVSDASGTPLPDARLTKVKPWMPDHGHGSNTQAKVAGVANAD